MGYLNASLPVDSFSVTVSISFLCCKVSLCFTTLWKMHLLDTISVVALDVPAELPGAGRIEIRLISARLRFPLAHQELAKWP